MGYESRITGKEHIVGFEAKRIPTFGPRFLRGSDAKTCWGPKGEMVEPNQGENRKSRLSQRKWYRHLGSVANRKNTTIEEVIKGLQEKFNPYKKIHAGNGA